jgi:hypothetical protein
MPLAIREDVRAVDFLVDDLVAVPVLRRDGLVVCHQLVDVALELAKSEACPDLRSPRVAEEGVNGAQALVVAVEGLGDVGSVFEVDQPQLLREVRAGEDAAVFEEGEQGLFDVEAVACVLYGICYEL